MDYIRLYPQYNIVQERRKQQINFSPNANILFERRSGEDRRSGDRVQLDTNLTRDIFEVKNKVVQLQQKTSPQNVSFMRTLEKIAPSSTDKFVRIIKPTQIETPRQIQKEKSEAGSVGGVIAAMLGGIMASTFLGTAAVGVVVGLGVYFGAKLVKNALLSHVKDKKN